MYRVSVLASLIPKTCVRRLTVAKACSTKFDISKIKKKQIHFQENENIPLYLRNGTKDYVLYYSVIGLLFIGSAASVHSIYKLANGK